VGAAAEGYKRFKVELGPTVGKLWAKIGNNVLYKSTERPTECFFIDLPPGQHEVTLRAQGEAGFGAGLRIREIGGKGPWFYETFDFNCGAPGLCDMASLRYWKEGTKTLRGGRHAPCGSVRIRNIEWQTGRMPDNLHPEDFRMQATLQVDEFAPKHPPKTPNCSS
jgi:hypothetical protein